MRNKLTMITVRDIILDDVLYTSALFVICYICFFVAFCFGYFIL